MLSQDLRLVFIKLKTRFNRIEPSAVGLFGLLLYLIGLFGEHMGWNKLAEPRKLNPNYHAYSNWSIHLLANQGILIHPVEQLAFAEFSFALEFDLKFTNTTLHVEFKSPWKPTEEHQLYKLLPSIRYLETGNFPHGIQNQALFQQDLQEYVYGNLSSELNQRNLQVSIPAQDFYLYSHVNVEHLDFDMNNINWSVIQRMRLRIPVRSSAPPIQLVRISFVDFFVEPDWLCSGSGWSQINPSKIGPEPLAFIKDQEVRLIHPKAGYANASHYMICDHFVCEVTKGAQETFAVDFPCLSAIQRDANVKELENMCQIPCKRVSKSTLKPEVVELGDKLYIYRITQPISINCVNSSFNQILDVPPTGALEMRIRCGCTLFHESNLIWSRQHSLPPTCISDDSLDLEVFQLVASAQTWFAGKQEMFHKIPGSTLENKVFYNISGHILAREVIDQIMNERYGFNAWYWDLMGLSLAILFYWGLYQLFYKVCIPPWFKFLDWLKDRSVRLMNDIIEDWINSLRYHGAVLPEAQHENRTAEAA